MHPVEILNLYGLWFRAIMPSPTWMKFLAESRAYPRLAHHLTYFHYYECEVAIEMMGWEPSMMIDESVYNDETSVSYSPPTAFIDYEFMLPMSHLKVIYEQWIAFQKENLPDNVGTI